MSLLCHPNNIFVSLVCQSYVLVCHSLCRRMSFTRHSFVCHSYAIWMHSYVNCIPFICTSMSLVCHSYVICMSLVRIHMSLVCHSYVFVCDFINALFKLSTFMRSFNSLRESPHQGLSHQPSKVKCFFSPMPFFQN